MKTSRTEKLVSLVLAPLVYLVVVLGSVGAGLSSFGRGFSEFHSTYFSRMRENLGDLWSKKEEQIDDPTPSDFWNNQ